MEPKPDPTGKHMYATKVPCPLVADTADPLLGFFQKPAVSTIGLHFVSNCQPTQQPH